MAAPPGWPTARCSATARARRSTWVAAGTDERAPRHARDISARRRHRPRGRRTGSRTRIAAVRRNVFDSMPGEGSWETVLLADGNIGIGGTPMGPRRTAGLLHPGGRVCVDLGEPGTGVRIHAARLIAERNWSPVFRWARAGRMPSRRLASSSGFHVDLSPNASGAVRSPDLAERSPSMATTVHGIRRSEALTAAAFGLPVSPWRWPGVPSARPQLRLGAATVPPAHRRPCRFPFVGLACRTDGPTARRTGVGGADHGPPLCDVLHRARRDHGGSRRNTSPASSDRYTGARRGPPPVPNRSPLGEIGSWAHRAAAH